MDRLVEIERKDWPILKEMYNPGEGRSYITYMKIDNYIRWFQQDPNIDNVKFFCLNGDFSDGTFAVIDIGCSYADTFNVEHDTLFRLISLLDFSKDFTLRLIRSEIRSTICSAIENAGEMVKNENILLYRCPMEVALQYDVRPSDDIVLKPLTDHDLEKLNSSWSHRNTNSLSLIERMVKYNNQIGAFTKDEKLVAWVLRFPTGNLALLQTDKDHYGHGYGTLVTKYVSKKIAEMGYDVYAGIFEGNHASRNLFDKLGFKNTGEYHILSGGNH